jgi:membrane protease YdiL (CAAX protease family)
MSEATIEPIEPLEPPIDEETPVPDVPTGWDLLKGVGIVWGTNIVLNLLFIVAVIALGKTKQIPVAPAILLTLACLAVAVGTSWHFTTRKYGKSIREGLRLVAVPGQVVAMSLGVGFFGAIIGGSIISLFGTGESRIAEMVDLGGPGVAPLFLLMILVVPPFEEVYYRGFLFPTFRRLAGVHAAFIIIVLWFGAVHAMQIAGDWIGLPVVMTMGAIFTYLRYKYDSLIPAILCHMSYNTSLVVVSATVASFSQ